MWVDPKIEPKRIVSFFIEGVADDWESGSLPDLVGLEIRVRPESIYLGDRRLATRASQDAIVLVYGWQEAIQIARAGND